MTLKTLVTGVAAAAVVGGAAAGVTSVASTVNSAAPAVQPVVWDIPLPQAPAPELEGPLLTTLNALAGGGSFGGAKEAYIQGGIGRIEALTADRAFNNAAERGVFPLSFTLSGIEQNGPSATANVTAAAANGSVATQNVLFVAGPSPTGWQISKASALALLSAAG
ncbi:hypothetical protein H7I53_24880 [Mycolicibacterium pulveris]|uniref:Low molecular weight antigen MTB12-like C-terminal domain-containing protein n=1 Tax=Mycolicibacterium pulveris TaxID=36813 RepID=A0A7I7UPG0_MYCPV|nr:hypothetical protein [Mycolicibacterium pulveris]MCV6983438.1 hypothetical protein [Mycolicibacterium pulveris]BBY83315.1 hypothetical protein MPUL_44730 [Mycolicibacterium pulveris]